MYLKFILRESGKTKVINIGCNALNTKHTNFGKPRSNNMNLHILGLKKSLNVPKNRQNIIFSQLFLHNMFNIVPNVKLTKFGDASLKYAGFSLFGVKKVKKSLKIRKNVFFSYFLKIFCRTLYSM